MMDKESILSVEDDQCLSFIVKRVLESKGYEVVCAYDIKNAIECLYRQRFDLILLDMMLPDGEGVELCEKIREKSFCPIIFISCLNNKDIKIRALELGGDDYITKPVEYEELLTRIRVNIRRSKLYNLGKTVATEESFQGLLVKHNLHEVWLTDEEEQPMEKLDLSPTEYELLQCFIHQPGELLLYHDLYRQIWGTDDMGDFRTVMVHVSNLRKKLGDYGKERIHTIRGAGYLFNLS